MVKFTAARCKAVRVLLTCVIDRPDQLSTDSSPPGLSRFEVRSIGQFSDHQSQVTGSLQLTLLNIYVCMYV